MTGSPLACVRLLIGALVVVVSSACVAPDASRRPDAPSARCLPHFPDSAGWLGADAGWSVAVPPADGAGGDFARPTVWLFGDTFVGVPGARDRVGARFIHNSIGRSRCAPSGEFQIEYAWSRDADGLATAALPPSERADFVWPFDGFFDGGMLYVLVLEVESVDPQGPLALPIRLIGTELVRVENPSAPPRKWKIERRRLTSHPHGFPGSGLLVRGEWLHLFAFRQDAPDRVPRFLTRLPLARVRAFQADLAEAFETLDTTGAWIPGFHPESARLLMEDSATEMTVRWHAAAGVYRATYSHPVVPADDPSPPGAVKVRTAHRLEGPWSPPVVVHVPAELEDTPVGLACYAGKEHARFAVGDELVATYACNVAPRSGESALSRLVRLQRSMDIYRPRTIVLPGDSVPAPAEERVASDE